MSVSLLNSSSLQMVGGVGGGQLYLVVEIMMTGILSEKATFKPPLRLELLLLFLHPLFPYSITLFIPGALKSLYAF